MPELRDIHTRQSAYQDSLLASFEQHLRNMVMRVQARVAGRLQAQLTITDGVIEQTAGNLRVLRNLNNLFMREMNGAGFQQLLESFVGEFRGQLTYLQDVLDYLSDRMQTPLPKWAPSKADVGLLSAFQANAVSSLETVMEQSAASAMTRGMFSVGGLKFGELVETMGQRFEQSIGKATGIAETAMNVFYRTATAQAFEAITSTQEAPVKYRYSGPVDLLERPFCRHLTDADKAYTREQIDRMNNGQLPNVFISGGGWNCRHQWILDTSEIEIRALEAA